jgi:hypothetical protein
MAALHLRRWCRPDPAAISAQRSRRGVRRRRRKSRGGAGREEDRRNRWQSMAICGNARGILVIVEGESGRELQFGSFTRVGCFSQRKIRGAGAGAAERAGRLAFEAANPLLKPLLKLCQTGPQSTKPPLVQPVACQPPQPVLNILPDPVTITRSQLDAASVPTCQRPRGPDEVGCARTPRVRDKQSTGALLC